MIIDEWFFSLMESWIRRKNPAFAASVAHMGPRKIVQKIQLYKLRQTIRYVYEKSEFYRRVFRENGLKPGDIKSTSDITKIPFTTSQSLQRDPYSFLAVPRERVARIFTSAGTTGPPKKLFFTRRDIDRITEVSAIGLGRLGVRQGDTIQVMFAYGRPSWGAGIITDFGGQKLGATVLASGNALRTEEQIQLIKESRSTVLCGAPSYLQRVTEEACKGQDLTQLGIHSIVLGAAPWSESLRHFLQEKWNAKAYDGYGLTEMGFTVAGECRMQNGLHLNEVDFLFEIVDPSTGEQLKPGEEGELVVTTLAREGMPFLRYRTHDITHFLETPCGCGLKTWRIGRMQGRTDDMVILGTGQNFYPNMFDQALLNLEGVLDYQLVIEKDGYRDKITVRAEVTQKTENMKEKVIEALCRVSPIDHDIKVTQTVAEPKVELLDPGALKKESEIKVRKILDKR